MRIKLSADQLQSEFVKKVEELWGDIIVYLSSDMQTKHTDEAPFIFTGVDIKLFVKREFRDKVLEFKEGQKVYFFGVFRDIAKRTVIIRKASIAE